ncbi:MULTISPECIES: NUDIX hydrolase [unclassified Cupriavidus]|uniref:NUDIX hydrolase n=1 Tax=unclassified Cupriavidus TaxID=2640874 RepID=UPI0010F87104|nr:MULTISPECIES: NUDIX domain-containing protein [unclassified Cupriavidus]MWL92143.1 NUDIX domain-containing protein [Cupriavidus sp. SW-Y-13]
MKTKVRATVVCTRGGRILLVTKDDSRWALPGGRPGKAEVLASAAARVLYEETTLIAKGREFLFQVIVATTVHHVFVANISKTDAAMPGKEIQRCQWFAPSELDEIVVSPTTRHIIEGFCIVRNR